MKTVIKETGTQLIPLNKIKLNRNSRAAISTDELSGLMQSIKSQGLLQPIGLIKVDGKFEVAYGNRRFLATSKLRFTNQRPMQSVT